MKLIVLACLATIAIAAPQFGSPFQRRFQPRPTFRATPAPQIFRPTPAPHTFHATPRPIAILRDNREDYGNGNFNYDFETENGITVNRNGSPGSRGQTNMQGSFSFPLPEGGFAEVRYFADENGFRAESPLLPIAPPLPAHAIEQIRVAEEQRRQGIIWD